MKIKANRSVNAASKVDEFMKYHEDPENYYRNPEGFSKMYEILEKYGDATEDVDVVFERATPEDQDKMLNLIKFKRMNPGDPGYARKLYYGALEGKIPDELGYGDYQSKDLLEGIVEGMEALMAEGWVNEGDFRTDL